MVNPLEVIINFLSRYKVCTYRELANRCWKHSKLTTSEVNNAIKYLLSKNAVDRKRIDNPYGTKYSFYYLPSIRSTRLNKILSYKLDLLNEHSKHTKKLGRFGECLVGKVLNDIDYEGIEYRKTQHKNVGIGRKGIDIWAEHPCEDYFQNFEVKNRIQPVDVNDIDNIRRKTLLASERWNLPIRSALVCSFIYHDTALKYAESNDVPVVITRKQFVPEEFRIFYEEYKVAFGSHYIEVVNLRNPPGYLRDLIEKHIVLHEYDDLQLLHLQVVMR